MTKEAIDAMKKIKSISLKWAAIYTDSEKDFLYHWFIHHIGFAKPHEIAHVTPFR